MNQVCECEWDSSTDEVVREEWSVLGESTLQVKFFIGGDILAKTVDIATGKAYYFSSNVISVSSEDDKCQKTSQSQSPGLHEAASL